MGILKFSQTFGAVRTVKFKDLKGKRVSVDVMTELYRAALGAKSTHALTDHNGNPTMHINVLLSVMINMQQNNINSIWVFDYDPTGDKSKQFHNPAKALELAKRNERKRKAQAKIKKIQLDDMFTDSDEEEEAINKLNKQTFSANRAMINDVKLMLNCLGITWVEAPSGIEGEQLASYLSKVGLVDGVYSSDTDPIGFGAKTLWRKNSRDKKIYEYTQESVFNEISHHKAEPTMDDFLKICAILGCDFCEKTPRVGPKTVLKKFETIKLTTEQLKAIEAFKKPIDLANVIYHNKDNLAFKHCLHSDLLNWLVIERSFSRERIEKQLAKVINLSTGELVKQAVKPKKKAKSKIVKAYSKPPKKGQKKKS